MGLEFHNVLILQIETSCFSELKQVRVQSDFTYPSIDAVSVLFEKCILAIKRERPNLNQGPLDLPSNALRLSYTPTITVKCIQL